MKRFTSLLLAAITVALMCVLLPATPVAATNQPAIDFYLTRIGDPTKVDPCVQHSNKVGGSVIFCRIWSAGPIPLWNFNNIDDFQWENVLPGQISGGNNYSVFVGQDLYEGCNPHYTGLYSGYWTCSNFVSQGGAKFQHIQEGGSFYTAAFWKWAQNQATANSCLLALYFDREGWDMVHNCT